MESQDSRRREARRRRILEHAESRIKRITGEVEKINCSLTHNDEASLINGITPNIQKEQELSSTNSHKKINLDSNVDKTNDFSLAAHEDITTKNTTVYHNSTIGTFLTIRLHIILLGVFVCVFFTNTSSFLPFVVLEAINIVFVLIECENKSMGLLGAILLASGISAEKIAFIFRYMQAFSMLRDDIAIYLFTVVVVHTILESIGFSKIEI